MDRNSTFDIRHSKILTSISSILSRSNHPSHLRTGRWGEKIAEKRLRRDGYRILGRRVRVGRRDEIDLLARSPNDVLVFVEVKTRRSEDFGRPVASVRAQKRKALSRAAVRYMEKLRRKPNHFRFDVVEVVGSQGEGEPEVRHLENVFTLESRLRPNW